MYEIYFYKDSRGNRPVWDYLEKLKAESNKDSRIKYNKNLEYLQALQKYGTMVGVPYVKHLDGDIWELRPLRDRILFAAWVDNSFVLLHVFMKETQKTPRREIEKAKRELKDIIERGLDYESKE
jgi:phage-related protein